MKVSPREAVYIRTMNALVLILMFLACPLGTPATNQFAGAGTGKAVTDPVTQWRQTYWATANGDGRYYALQRGRLLAYRRGARSAIWAFGHKLALPVLFNSHQHTVCVFSRRGRVYALHAGTGRLVWSASLGHPAAGIWDVANSDHMFVVAYPGGLVVFDAATGKEYWRITDSPYPYSVSVVEVIDDVVLRGYVVEGAILTDKVDAFDAHSGKSLWSDTGRWTKIMGNRVTLHWERYEPDYDPPTNIEERVVDVKTGRVLSSWHNQRKLLPH